MMWVTMQSRQADVLAMMQSPQSIKRVWVVVVSIDISFLDGPSGPLPL